MQQELCVGVVHDFLLLNNSPTSELCLQRHLSIRSRRFEAHWESHPVFGKSIPSNLQQTEPEKEFGKGLFRTKRLLQVNSLKTSNANH